MPEKNGIPEQKSFQVTLELPSPRPRIDQVLLEALRRQDRNPYLRNISRTEFKELFKKKRIRIKGQAATPSSALAQGTTFVDILGYEDLGPDAMKLPLNMHGNIGGTFKNPPTSKPTASRAPNAKPAAGSKKTLRPTTNQKPKHGKRTTR